MTRRVLSLLLALVLSLSLTGCWAEDNAEPDDFWDDGFSSADEPANEPSPLQISSFALPYLAGQTLDPVSCIDGIQQTVGLLLYEGLITLDAQFQPQPLLCQSWQYDAEKFSYTFTLRSGVTFSDGSSLSANDVLSTYRRAAASERYGARFANVASMRSTDVSTLVITLTRGDSAFPSLLDIPIVKSGTENSTVPLGTGPYRYSSENGAAVLERNAAWHQGGTLPLERIELVAAKDNETAASLFASYDVHLLLVDPTGTDAIPTSGEVSMLDVPSCAMQYLGFNTRRTLLADAAVRSAMSAVLDRSSLVSAFLSGHGRPAQFPLNPASPLYPNTAAQSSSADYAAALESAGLSAERPRSLTLLVNEENPFKCAVAGSICAQLSSDALSVTLRALPWDEYLAALQGGNFDLYLGEVRLTADWDLSALLSPAGALNYGGYEGEPLLAAMNAFLAAESEASAAAFYASFAKETPFAPLLFKSQAVLSPSGLISGMSPSVSSPFTSLENWSIHLSAES